MKVRRVCPIDRPVAPVPAVQGATPRRPGRVQTRRSRAPMHTHMARSRKETATTPALRLVLPEESGSLPFPVHASRGASTRKTTITPTRSALTPPAPARVNNDDRPADAVRFALDAMDNVSRRMEDLARQLNCLGHFEHDDDGPRAA